MKIFKLFVAFAIICFAFLPAAHAVVPAPDGGYPGFTTAEGANALQNVTTGVGNTANGWRSLFANTAGSLNTAIGAGTLLLNTGDNNTATGALALLSNTNGHDNTAVGSLALLNNTAGNSNIALGALAGQNVNGTNNIVIGNDGVSDESNTIRIGNETHTAVYMTPILNDFHEGGNPVHINPLTGKLFYSTPIFPQRGVTRDIQSMDKSSEGILALNPVTFYYKTDKTNTRQFGLIAEEVTQVNPDLVVRDKEEKPYSVRYEQVNAMLLNEFLKEHKKVE